MVSAGEEVAGENPRQKAGGIELAATTWIDRREKGGTSGQNNGMA